MDQQDSLSSEELFAAAVAEQEAAQQLSDQASDGEEDGAVHCYLGSGGHEYGHDEERLGWICGLVEWPSLDVIALTVQASKEQSPRAA